MQPGRSLPQIALLGPIHTANCTVVYTGVGTTGRRVLRTRPAAAALTRCSGAAMIAIGVLLLIERVLRLPATGRR